MTTVIEHKNIKMKVHNTLEELLLDFLDVYFGGCINSDGDEQSLINNYVSNNSLALGKPEPLAKNKQFEKSCCKDNTVQWTRQRIKCTKCGYMRIGKL